MERPMITLRESFVTCKCNIRPSKNWYKGAGHFWFNVLIRSLWLRIYYPSRKTKWALLSSICLSNGWQKSIDNHIPIQKKKMEIMSNFGKWNISAKNIRTLKLWIVVQFWKSLTYSNNIMTYKLFGSGDINKYVWNPNSKLEACKSVVVHVRFLTYWFYCCVFVDSFIVINVLWLFRKLSLHS